jgi:hypothetical protein
MCAMGILQNGNSVKLIPGTLLKNMSKTNVMLEKSFVFGYEAAYFDGETVTFQRNILSEKSV